MTLSHEAVAVLDEAERLLVEKGWTQGASARDREGRKASARDSDAVCYCLYGAVRAALAPGQIDVQEEIFDALHAATDKIGATSFITWNDARGRTKDEVLDLIRRVKGDAS